LLKVRWEEAQRDFERIVEHIRLRYKPRKIYQWGSLLDLSRFSEISDIDIALEEIDGPEEYFAILGDAMKMTDFPLDIVEMKNLDPETAAEIRKKGRLVYER
jgi:predicted nucleotidyltransferase